MSCQSRLSRPAWRRLRTQRSSPDSLGGFSLLALDPPQVRSLPQLNAVVAQRLREMAQLAAGERPRVPADHDCVEPAIGISDRG